MSIHRTYFSKNNTLISNNLTNNSQNPVTEVSYGMVDKQVSRFIFDVDFTSLRSKIEDGTINPNRIVKHVLHMTNTIGRDLQYVGKKSYSESIERATSFELEMFNISEDWDEGNGYDFMYDDTLASPVSIQASNWRDRKTNINWTEEGAYVSGITEIIGSQRFEKGNENLEIDITDYINQRLLGTGYTGTSAFTGNSFGLGVKFIDELENLETELKQAVAFHTKYTNTWFEPYIETTVDDVITDDRNYFYQDKDNELYLYVNFGGFANNIVVNDVNIYDNNDILVTTISGDSIINVSKGIYKIILNISSAEYPDAVLFRDEWNLTINGRETTFSGEFYLISPNMYYTFNQSNMVNFDNYHFYFWGINERENVRTGNVKKIKLSIKELYQNQNNFIPLDIEYRLYTTVGKKYEIDVIPFTKVNRTNTGYEFNLDTSWLVPQDYCLQIRMRNGNYFETKQSVSFTVVNDNIFTG
mgnify:CR=1 FL=1